MRNYEITEILRVINTNPPLVKEILALVAGVFYQKELLRGENQLSDENKFYIFKENSWTPRWNVRTASRLGSELGNILFEGIANPILFTPW